MMYSTTTNNVEIQNEFREIVSSDTVEVSIRVRNIKEFCVPDPKGNAVVKAVFNRMTYEDYAEIDKYCTFVVHNPETTTVTDYDEMRGLVVRRLLKSWDLNIPIKRRKDGWLTDACYNKIKKLPAPLITAMVTEFDKSNIITEDEEETINKQSAILFSKNSKGVASACEAVSLFCNLSNFWEKFGLNYFSIKKMPYKKYLLLRIMVGKDSEAQAALNRAAKSSSHASRARRPNSRFGAPIVVPDV